MSVSQIARDRAARAAKNQALFRGANERVKHLNEAFSLVVPVGEWICECANADCIERIEMSIDAYEGVRLNETHFFITPSDEHFWPDVERVIEHNDRYWVVELGGAGSDGAAAGAKRRPLPLQT